MGGGSSVPNDVIQQRLLEAAPADIDALRPQLERRAEEFAATASAQLARTRPARGADVDRHAIRATQAGCWRRSSATTQSSASSRWASSRRKLASYKPTCATGNAGWHSSIGIWSKSRGGSRRSTRCGRGGWNRWGWCIFGRRRIDEVRAGCGPILLDSRCWPRRWLVDRPGSPKSLE